MRSSTASSACEGQRSGHGVSCGTIILRQADRRQFSMARSCADLAFAYASHAGSYLLDTHTDFIAKKKLTITFYPASYPCSTAVLPGCLGLERRPTCAYRAHFMSARNASGSLGSYSYLIRAITIAGRMRPPRSKAPSTAPGGSLALFSICFGQSLG